ncbi:MAG: four-helix bundle copper-binding protein [Ardenticatenales bacterium]|nr:four-helix bundle copper-binding protein [Ardenticatenales bacterium]
MHDAKQMLQTHPRPVEMDLSLLAQAIEELSHCAQSCTACADACLGENQLDMLRQCIRLCLDCADVCATTGRVATRQTETQWHLLHSQLRACITACQLCGAECARHAQHHEHCRICTEVCQRCEASCTRLLEAIERTLKDPA